MINKYICKECETEIKVNKFEDIVLAGKVCADCRVKHITGGIKEKKVFHNKKVEVYTGPLRKEDIKKKKKKPLSQKQKEANRLNWDTKWEREVYGRQNYNK